MADHASSLEQQQQPFNFRGLPVELRLLILCHTDLGPSSTANYPAKYEKLFIHDGRLDEGHDLPFPWSYPSCHVKSTHHAPTRSCDCRVLPTALFLVDRLMYAEASNVFWTHASSFSFYSSNFMASLDALRCIVPRWQQQHTTTKATTTLHLEFIMTAEQADGWGPGAQAYGLPEFHILRVWPSLVYPVPNVRAGWDAIVDFLAAQQTQQQKEDSLHIGIDIGSCGWQWMQEGDVALDDAFHYEWFRFLYDFAMGVATALCRLNNNNNNKTRMLRGVKFDMFPFGRVGKWLDREVMGCRHGYGELKQPSGRERLFPSWHDVDKRLEGSNYDPTVTEQ